MGCLGALLERPEGGAQAEQCLAGEGPGFGLPLPLQGGGSREGSNGGRRWGKAASCVQLCLALMAREGASQVVRPLPLFSLAGVLVGGQRGLPAPCLKPQASANPTL